MPQLPSGIHVAVDTAPLWMPDIALQERSDHLLPQVVNGWGDLFQIAAPDKSSKRS
jgi:hypothetical protein